MQQTCCWVRMSFDQLLLEFLALKVLLFLLLLSAPSLSPVQGQSPGCNYTEPKTCGNLSIPYPFGMSPECGLPEYRISCRPNASYGAGDIAFLQLGTPSTPELQVLEFAINTLLVNSTHLKAMPEDCRNSYDVYGHAMLELPADGPFILAEDNLFVVIGCRADGNCTAITNNDAFNGSTISCAASCFNQGGLPFCNAYSCCTSAIPPGSLTLDFYGRGIDYKDFPDVCGFATVLTPSAFNSTGKYGIFAAGHYGILLSWALKSDQDCAAVCHDKADCLSSGHIKGGINCNCTQGYRGDGYKAGTGCQDIDECQEGVDDCENPPLGVCINTNGSYKCNCTSGEGTGRLGTCPIPEQDKNVWLPGLLGSLAGAALLGVCLCFIFLSRRAYRRRKDREDNFKRMGGDQLTSLLFSERELIKATKGFTEDHVLGEGGFGKVYWGKLSKGQGDTKVAIKKAKSKAVEEQVAQIQSFVREMVLLNKSVHKNVVRLLGCCVETSIPLLVYEYVEKGTLRDYLKPQSKDAYYQGRAVRSDSSLMWAWRLHVVVETAEAVGFLHNLSEPVFHLDLKSPNILIDRHYNPKVADFGLSCFLTSDATHITNQLPVGTFGYVDPEYYHSLHVTSKCDVYSFGVILLELISGMQANQGPGAVLAYQFRTIVDFEEEIAKQVNQLPGFIDMRLGTDGVVLGSIQSVAKLARRCVALKGSDRPSMQEVLIELRHIQAKTLGRSCAKGRVPDGNQCVGEQKLYGNENSDERECGSSFNYEGIPSDGFSSSSSFFPPPQSIWDHSPGSNNPQSTTIELGQWSNGRE